MSTGYYDSYKQQQNKRWTYKIMDDEVTIYDSNEDVPNGFSSEDEAYRHCDRNHANSGSSGSSHYFDDDWDMTNEKTIDLALSYYPSHFCRVPSDIKNYRSLAIKYIKKYGYKVFNSSNSDKIKNDREVVLLAYELWLDRPQRENRRSCDDPLDYCSAFIKAKIGKNDPLLYLRDGVEEDPQETIDDIDSRIKAINDSLKKYQKIANKYLRSKTQKNLDELKNAESEYLSDIDFEVSQIPRTLGITWSNSF